MAPVVHGLEDKYGGYARFSYLDIDDSANDEIREIMGHEYRWRPFIFFVDSQGEVVNFYIGYTPSYTLEQALVDFLVGEGVFEK